MIQTKHNASQYLHYWLAAFHLPKIGPSIILKCLDHFATMDRLFAASREELSSIGLTAAQIRAFKEPNWAAVEEDLAWVNQQANCHILCFIDEDYPQLLKEIAVPPLVLFVIGNKTCLNNLQLAMVGARHASSTGIDTAKKFAYSLACAQLTITSGLALGIDGACHRGALDAKGITIGVTGSGLQKIYPKAHHLLVDEIVQNQGAVISEFPLLMQPLATNFPRRNRMISGLSIGVLIVEAALRSGSLVTARHALEQGREVFAIPGSIHNPLARGCHHLIRQGAKLVETVEDVLEELVNLRKVNVAHIANMREICLDHLDSVNRLSDVSSACINQEIPKIYARIWPHIGCVVTTLDQILLHSGLTANEVSSMLLELELQGYIQAVTGGYVRTIK